MSKKSAHDATKSALHSAFHSRWSDGDLELIEKRLLLRRGRHDSSEPDLAPVGRRQDNVRALQRGEERQGAPE